MCRKHGYLQEKPKSLSRLSPAKISDSEKNHFRTTFNDKSQEIKIICKACSNTGIVHSSVSVQTVCIYWFFEGLFIQKSSVLLPITPHSLRAFRKLAGVCFHILLSLIAWDSCLCQDGWPLQRLYRTLHPFWLSYSNFRVGLQPWSGLNTSSNK